MQTQEVALQRGNDRLRALAGGNAAIALGESGPGLPRPRGHDDAVLTLAFAFDSQLLASGSDDKTIKLWNLATRKERATLRGHEKGVTSLAFSADGKTLASAGIDRMISRFTCGAFRQ